MAHRAFVYLWNLTWLHLDRQGPLCPTPPAGQTKPCPG